MNDTVEEVKEEPKKWRMTIGIHKGTLMSRDRERPKEKDSLEECLAEVAQAEKWYNSIGYYIWFANAIDPDGKNHALHPGTPYV